MINITRDGGQTIEQADESLFEKREGVFDDANEHTTWVEYWEGEKLVHRSAHVTIKRVQPIQNVAGGFSGQ